MMNTSAAIEAWIPYWTQKPQARVRLFCFPYAGGGATIFRTWSENLPQEIEVCPIQLPGRESRLLEPAVSSWSTLIALLAEALEPLLDMPYAFFGHSMGTLISFELARHLRRTGNHAMPLRLFMSAHRAPQLPDPDPPTYHLPETEFIEELRRLQGTPEEILQHEEILRLLIPLLRADFCLCETYAYQQESPLACPITAFGSLQDAEVTRESVMAWKAQTSRAFKVRFFAGDHFFVNTAQHSLWQMLARDLIEDLAE